MFSSVFENLKTKAADLFSEFNTNEEEPNNPFLSQTIIYQRSREKIKNIQQNYLFHLVNGIDLLTQIAKHLPKEEQEQLNQFFSILDEALIEGKHLNSSAEDPLQFSTTIKKDFIDLIYEIAKKLLDEQRYQEASDLLLFITHLTPEYSDLWLAWGMAEQACEHYDVALMLYAESSLLNFQQPHPHLFSAECYYLQGNCIQAEECLNLAVSLQNNYPEIEGRVERLKALLNNN